MGDDKPILQCMACHWERPFSTCVWFGDIPAKYHIDQEKCPRYKPRKEVGHLRVIKNCKKKPT